MLGSPRVNRPGSDELGWSGLWAARVEADRAGGREKGNGPGDKGLGMWGKGLASQGVVVWCRPLGPLGG